MAVERLLCNWLQRLALDAYLQSFNWEVLVFDVLTILVTRIVKGNRAPKLPVNRSQTDINVPSVDFYVYFLFCLSTCH